MQTPIDADEEVDFNAAAPPIEDEKYKQTELFHLNDYIPKALQDLMPRSGIHPQIPAVDSEMAFLLGRTLSHTPLLGSLLLKPDSDT